MDNMITTNTLTTKRVSGTGYDPNTQAGKAAIKQAKYLTQSTETSLYEIDSNKIKDIVINYINTADKPNRVGLRRALDIHKDTYLVWLHGYVSRSDIDNDNVIANTSLSDALRAGDDAIMEWLIVNEDKYGQSKYIRLLETYGEISTKDNNSINIGVQLNLGDLKKYGV